MHKIIIPIFLLLVFLSACSSDSEKATNLIHKANLLLNEKGLQEPQKAIDYLTKAIKLQPDNDDAYNIRGNIHFIQGKNQLAIDDFTKAIQINATCADYFNNRGIVYNKLGRYKLAIKDFDDAILFASNDAAYYNNRGSVHLKHGDKKIGCLDAGRACVLKSCALSEWAKKEGYCR